MFCHDRTFTVETEHGRYPAVVTASALRQLNANVEMFSWSGFVYRNRHRIYEAALRKYEQSGLDAHGRIVVGPEDILVDVMTDETPVDAARRRAFFPCRNDDARSPSRS